MLLREHRQHITVNSEIVNSISCRKKTIAYILKSQLNPYCNIQDLGQLYEIFKFYYYLILGIRIGYQINQYVIWM